MEALLIAVLGLMLAARPLAAASEPSEPEPARRPGRRAPRVEREREREAELHRRRVQWLSRDLDAAVARGDREAARRLRALVAAEAARHDVRLRRLASD
jgi:hypothetical protein